MRFLTLLIGFLISMASAQGATFTDTVGHPQATQIDELSSRGIVHGYANGLFRPDVPINRAEYLAILSRAVTGETASLATTGCFTDFAGEPQWFWVPACAAKDRGIVSGYPDGSFRGAQNVNLAEALTMAVRAWKIPLPQYVRAPDHWYDPYFDAVAERDVAVYFSDDPSHLLTRGDVAWLFVALGQPLAMVTESSSASSASLASSASSVYVHNVCGNGVKEGAEQCDDGNGEDGDGCSSICIIVPEPIQHSAIRLDQRALGTDSRAGGSSQTTLFSFDANARWQDAILTGIKFNAAQGSFTAAVNYRLYEDQDGDGKTETPVGSGLVRDNVLTFSDLRARIFVLRGKRFEIRADLVRTTGSLALAFHTGDSAYVEAVGAVDGRQLIGIRTNGGACLQGDNCWIAVYTLDAVPVTLTERGNLFVTMATQPVRSHQLLAGEVTDDLLRLSFRAAEEDILIRRLAVTGATDAVSELQFFDPSATKPFATAHASGCKFPAAGTFCATADFLVRKDQVRDVVVRAVIRSADDGARSGDALTLTLPADAAATNRSVEALGASSQQDLLQNDGDGNAEGEIFVGRATAGAGSAIVSPVHDIVHTALMSIANASRDLDGSMVPTGLRTIGVFRFTAQSKPLVARTSRSVSLTTLTFDVSATNVRFETGSFVLVNTVTNSVFVPCTETARTGSIRVTCTGLAARGVHGIIPFGESVDLGLRGLIESPQLVSGTSVLTVNLTSLNNRDASGSVEWSDGTSSFHWVDIPEAAVDSTVYRMP